MEQRLSFDKTCVIVIDSFGIGQAKDADKFNDQGADTFGHILEYRPDIKLDNLYKLGLGALHDKFVDKHRLGYACKLHEASSSKDTMTGHLEMMGIETKVPLRTFTEHGFPDELIMKLEKETGHKFIGNKSASGTEILKELGMREIMTNGHELIIYTSADSVLQICGHEKITGLDELYRCCEIARKLTLDDPYRIGRVIARPYIGNDIEHFERTSNRHDYALDPIKDTVLNVMMNNGLDTIGIGKIHDIFNGKGISRSIHSDSSIEGMHQTIEILKQDYKGLLFTNLVDFDAKWGHRRNVEGYANELEAFDELLGQLLDIIDDDTLLIITADHGNDPTFRGTDHTRECVPCLIYANRFKGHGILQDQTSFGAIGHTLCTNFGLAYPDDLIGDDLMDQLY